MQLLNQIRILFGILTNVICYVQITKLIQFTMIIIKNYNFLNCDWFKNLLFQLPSCYRTFCYSTACYQTVQ